MYGTPQYFLIDNGLRIAAKCFGAVCALLYINKYLQTVVYPHTNGKIEKFNKIIVKRLRQYVQEEQRDWNAFLHPMAYA